MKTITKAILLGTVVGLASPLTQAALSVNDAAAACRTEAQVRYALNGEIARIKFKGIQGSATKLTVRLQVLPAEGKAFLAKCDLNGQTGEVLALTPQSAPGQALASTAH